MAAMPPDGPGKILIPRWIQLVGLPLVVVGTWLLVSAVNGAVFVFVVAALIAILLNPIVRAFCALHIPRGISVALVYVCFAVAIGGISVIAGTVVAREVQSVANQVNDQFRTDSHGVTPADRKLRELQRWINRSSPVKVNVIGPGKRLVHHIDVSHLQKYSGRAVVGRPDARDHRVREPVQPRAGDRDLGVHAARRAAAVALPAPGVPRQRARRRPGDPGRACAARLHPRPDDGVARGRRDRPASASRSSASPACSRTDRRTRSCSARWAAAVEIIPYLGPWLGALRAGRGRRHGVAHRRASRSRSCSCSSTRSRATSSCRS